MDKNNEYENEFNNNSQKDYQKILENIKNKVENGEQPTVETVLTENEKKESIIDELGREKTQEEIEKAKLFDSEVVLEVLGLRKKIGLKTIVNDISFEMKKGEIIGLLGPNGSGKTTTMRMMVGLTKATKGEIYCFEKPLGIGKTKMLKEIGAMIESPEFYNYMSGWSNLKQISRACGKKVSRAKLKELVEFVGLTSVINKKVKKYSLGMRQRLGLAQALLNNPKILILDEPVNGLDPQGVQDFREKLKEIAAKGVSILISSHLLDEIEKVSDRIIVLENGRIIANDTLDNLKSGVEEKTLLTTYDNHRANFLLLELGMACERTEEGFIFTNISREDKGRILSYLITNGVEIDSIKSMSKTLEQSFLEMTGKGVKK